MWHGIRRCWDAIQKQTTITIPFLKAVYANLMAETWQNGWQIWQVIELLVVSHAKAVQWMSHLYHLAADIFSSGKQSRWLTFWMDLNSWYIENWPWQQRSTQKKSKAHATFTIQKSLALRASVCTQVCVNMYNLSLLKPLLHTHRKKKKTHPGLISLPAKWWHASWMAESAWWMLQDKWGSLPAMLLGAIGNSDGGLLSSGIQHKSLSRWAEKLQQIQQWGIEQQWLRRTASFCHTLAL